MERLALPTCKLLKQNSDRILANHSQLGCDLAHRESLRIKKGYSRWLQRGNYFQLTGRMIMPDIVGGVPESLIVDYTASGSPRPRKERMSIVALRILLVDANTVRMKLMAKAVISLEEDIPAITDSQPWATSVADAIGRVPRTLVETGTERSTGLGVSPGSA